MTPMECSDCTIDPILPDCVTTYCARHQPERYERLAWQAISIEMTYRHHDSFTTAIPGALQLVEDYARGLGCEVAPLRTAIEAEATRRRIAA